MSNKPHAVFVPFPTQGHINPLLKLAKLVHNKGFYITFVNTEYNHKRLIKSKGSNYLENLPNFSFETIPDGLPEASDTDTTQDIPTLCRSTRKHSLIPFQELLATINQKSSSVPPVSCIIADGVMAFTLQAAQELDIPFVLFWTFGACGFLSLKLCADSAEKGITPFKDSSYLTDGTLDHHVDWIPGLKNIQLKHIASFIQTTDPNDFMLEFLKGEFQATSKASAIILYTFDSLEQEMLNVLTPLFPPIYTIAPLQPLIDQIPNKTLDFLDCSLWKAEEQCIQWLNSKEKSSVLYVNFGSIAVLTPEEMLELAWGLSDSKKNFFWIIRPDLLKGNSSFLLNEFFEETKERGLVLGWCDQEKVLNHDSVGGFLTHCGWNSTIEGITAGVSFLCRPCAKDQGANSRFICGGDLGIGIEIERNWGRGEIERVVRKLMDEEEGKEMKKRAMELKKKAAEASTGPEGSSFFNLEKLVKEVLLDNGKYALDPVQNSPEKMEGVQNVI